MQQNEHEALALVDKSPFGGARPAEIFVDRQGALFVAIHLGNFTS